MQRAKDMQFKYWLPDENNEKQEYETDKNAVIIVGANGSGKSKLGAWIEQQSMDLVHRIGAQRNLNFNENIPLRNYSQSEDLVFYGTDNPGSKANKGYRWDWEKYTTKMIDDFEAVLSAILALKNEENDAFVSEYKKSKESNHNMPDPPTTVIDKLQTIWDYVFPQRKLDICDSKFYAVLGDQKYLANQMSDGERSVLYFASQVLCVPKDKILIIDEPEIHLHKSIMNTLWTTLEQYRKDCLFIYITHDINFATLHEHADKFWIKQYDGVKWVFKKIEKDINLPENLLLDILGSRKSVLFVEGGKFSCDIRLYSILYPDYYIIPCGSCEQVISRTKAFRNTNTLHHFEVYGIIDRDFRSEHELEIYKAKNVYAIKVAEIENLFITEEVVRFIASCFGKNENDIFSAIKNYIVKERFEKQIDSQISKSVLYEIKYRLSNSAIDGRNKEEINSSLNDFMSSLRYEDIWKEQNDKFQNALSNDNYKDIIKIFNEKNLSSAIGHYFGIENKEYIATVISIMSANEENKKKFVSALTSYLPTEIPISLR